MGQAEPPTTGAAPRRPNLNRAGQDHQTTRQALSFASGTPTVRGWRLRPHPGHFRRQIYGRRGRQECGGCGRQLAVEPPLAAGAVVETAVEELIVQSVRTASAQTMTSAKHGVASAHLVTGSHVFLVCCRRKPGVANRGSGSIDGMTDVMCPESSTEVQVIRPRFSRVVSLTHWANAGDFLCRLRDGGRGDLDQRQSIGIPRRAAWTFSEASCRAARRWSPGWARPRRACVR